VAESPNKKPFIINGCTGSPRLNMSCTKAIAMSTGFVTSVVNNYNTNNSSVANQTDVHSGSLDTGIDSYHDKLAYADI